jgi:methylmalonyl-CoA mutase
VAINKFDRKGASDALRDVAKQVQRNKEAWTTPADQMPVFGTMAARFNDDGVTALYQALKTRLAELGLPADEEALPWSACATAPTRRRWCRPPAPVTWPKSPTRCAATKKPARRRAWPARSSSCAPLPPCWKLASRAKPRRPKPPSELASAARGPQDPRRKAAGPVARDAEGLCRRRVRGEDPRQGNPHRADHKISQRHHHPQGGLPQYEDHGEILKWLMLDNVPGSYPYTAGTFAFKREGEDPTRMFAGEGDPFRTNRRFKLVSQGMDAKRLSTAFDSVTLYGNDPDRRPDIYGKIGNSGVNVATLDDMKVLYGGFDLCNPTTSVSMTINGPAPSILAMFMNTAIDQNLDKFKADNGREPTDTETAKIREWVLANVRGTVQADILKEDQGQNTCIFSTEFSLKVMGDIASYFVHHNVRNFYSVSISGYHIAEAGPTRSASWRSRCPTASRLSKPTWRAACTSTTFAPNLSFFFSNGMDPEYTVMGRVARRIWAVAMKEKYGANERSQKLKYHIQTSGRSLHAQEIQFNDIRTTLQALIAIYDNCNSLHTNAFDEAITTPTEDSVRRAMAIQLIINREWGLAKNENPNQGAFIIEELTELVEEAVLSEFEAHCRARRRAGRHGDGLPARQDPGRVHALRDAQAHRRAAHHRCQHLPQPPWRRRARHARAGPQHRGGKAEPAAAPADFHTRHAAEAPKQLKRLQQAVIDNGNVFEVLMDAVRVCSLGQITNALFEVGGQYRRNM